MKLYYMPGTCSQAVHITLSELGGAYTLERVNGDSKTTETGADFTAINPLGYVPALTLAGGETLLEAPAILQYLADQSPETKLAPIAGSLERTRLQQLLNFVSSEFHKAFGPFFAPIKPEGALREQALNRLSSRFDWLNDQLADGRPYLMGPDFTVADAYAFVVASWHPVVDFDLAQWPHVQAFMERVQARPKVAEVLSREGLAA